MTRQPKSPKAKDAGQEIPALDTSGLIDEKTSGLVDPAQFFTKKYSPFAQQEQFLDEARAFLASDSERVMINNISTAGGKSPLAVAVASAWISVGGKSVILCPNKELLKQYACDFPSEVEAVFGAAEFSCPTTGKDCGHIDSREGCDSRRTKRGSLLPSPCPYRQNQSRAFLSWGKKPLLYTPHLYLAQKSSPFLGENFPRGDGLMVVDEAHLLPDILSANLSLSLPVDLIDAMIAWRHSRNGTTSELASDPKLGLASSFFVGLPQRANHDGLPLGGIKELQLAWIASLSADLDQFLALAAGRILGEDLGYGPSDSARFYRGEASQKELSESFGDLPASSQPIPVTAHATDATVTGRGDGKWLSVVQILDNLQDDELKKVCEYLEGLRERLSLISRYAGETDWLCEITPVAIERLSGGDLILGKLRRGDVNDRFSLSIRPGVIPVGYLKSFFFGFSKVILMSGTLFKNHIERLGLVTASMIGEDGKITGARRFEASSRILPARRMVHIDYANGTSVNFRNIDEAFDKFARYIVTDVCRAVPGERGIIHVSSAAQAKKMAEFGNFYAAANAVAGSRPVARFIYAENGKWRDSFREFTAKRGEHEQGQNLFLVAARRYEGLDLKDGLARINIVAKAPHANMRDSMVLSLDSLFGSYSTVSALTSFIQAVNRAVRHPGDWALNICLDTSIEHVFRKCGGDLPAYIDEAIKEERDSDWLSYWRIPEGSSGPRKLLTKNRWQKEDKDKA